MLDKWFSNFSVQKRYPEISLKYRFPDSPNSVILIFGGAGNTYVASTPDIIGRDGLSPTP